MEYNTAVSPNNVKHGKKEKAEKRIATNMQKKYHKAAEKSTKRIKKNSEKKKAVLAKLAKLGSAIAAATIAAPQGSGFSPQRGLQISQDLQNKRQK